MTSHRTKSTNNMDHGTSQDPDAIGPVTRIENAKAYMEDSRIPDMFRSLLAALMVQKPEDPLEYLDAKLEEIKLRGMENIDWESFIYNLHPSRDPLHCKLVQDGRSNKQAKGIPQYENYEPKVFQLTESSD